MNSKYYVDKLLQTTKDDSHEAKKADKTVS